MSTKTGEGSGVQDVGNEFAGGLEAALAAEAGSEPDEPSEPEEAPEADEPEGESTWADPDPANPDEADAQAESESTSPAPAAPAELEIKTANGSRKFVLTPDNAELRRELTRAQGVPALQSKLDKTVAELGKAKERAGVWDELQSLTEAGHDERVVRAVLGKNFDRFRKQLVDEELGLQNGDPDQQAAIKAARIQRDREFEQAQAKREIEARDNKLREIEDREAEASLRTAGLAAAAAFDVRKVIDDPDQAHALNKSLWRLAWQDLEDQAKDTGRAPTASEIRAAFEATHRVLVAGIKKATTKQVDKIIETKKQDAKTKVRAAATERYPTTAPDTAGWDGKSAKDLLRRLVNGKK